MAFFDTRSDKMFKSEHYKVRFQTNHPDKFVNRMTWLTALAMPL